MGYVLQRTVSGADVLRTGLSDSHSIEHSAEGSLILVTCQDGAAHDATPATNGAR